MIEPPFNVERRRVALRDHETETIAAGRGEPVVLVHALGLDRGLWGPLISARPPGRFIAYDLRGHASAADAPPAAEIDAYADDLRQVLDAQGLARARLAGLSFGGAIVQRFAALHPDRVAALDLMGTMPAGSPAMAARADAAEGAAFEGQVGATLDRWFGPQAALSPLAVLYAETCLRRASPAHWRAWWTALGGFRGAEALGAFRMPVRVVAGGLDTSTPPALMEAMAAAIPGARYDVLSQGPHLFPLVEPDALARLLYP